MNDTVEYIKSKCIVFGGRDALYELPGVSEVECEVIEQRRWVQKVRVVYKIENMNTVDYVAIEYTEPLTEMQEGSEDSPNHWKYYQVFAEEVKVIKYVQK